VYRSNGTRACEPGDDLKFSGFLNGDRSLYLTSGGGVQIRRPDCSMESGGDLSERTAEVRAVCADENLVLLAIGATGAGTYGLAPYEMTLMSYSSREVIRRWRWDYGAMLAGVIFADSCKVACTGKDQDINGASHAACWNTANGEQADENRRLRFISIEPSGLAFSGGQINASGGPFLLATQYRLPWWCALSPGLGIECWPNPVRRVLWDVETGKETLSWAVPKQHLDMQELEPRRVMDAYAVGLSVTGKYLAEGGEASVQLYAIE
jgi:hypothetical protein